MKKIAVITRDCAGINACLRAVVRVAAYHNIETVGIRHGYRGLINADFIPLDRRSVSGIISLGGTILKTARANSFRDKEVQKKAVTALKDNDIDGVIVIGGNGSLTAAHILAHDYGIKVIGVPATIDNDISGIDSAIGCDTAVNVVIDALDKIRDTATSLERIFAVEVMGREYGYIALEAALAGGCEEVLLPEKDFDINEICREISKGNHAGKVSWIIIVAEGKAKAFDVARKITSVTGLETREVVLGHIQRGGRPTAFDRILAARLGEAAVCAIAKGESDKCVGIKNGDIFTLPLKEAVKPKVLDLKDRYRLVKILT